MGEKVDVLGELVLSHDGAGRGERFAHAGDVVMLSEVICSLRSRALTKERDVAERVRIEPRARAREVNRHWRWSVPESKIKIAKVRAKKTAMHRLMVPGAPQLDPRDGYLLSDIAQFLRCEYSGVVHRAKELKILKKRPGSIYWAPLTRDQAKLLIQVYRYGRGWRIILDT